MNVFDQAGIRNKHRELVRNEHPQFMFCRIEPDHGSIAGDSYQVGHYLCTLMEDIDDDGECCVEMVLSPTKES